MKTRIGFIKKSDVTPKKGDICGECRDNGLNVCELDEICQVRLAEALGRDQMEVVTSIDYAAKKGLLEVRLAKVKGTPLKFVKLSEGGRLFFASK
ncbi:MAG: hypothetical protein ACE5G7_01130 [Candidatus Hydrothermarchaeaceae archaeon]